MQQCVAVCGACSSTPETPSYCSTRCPSCSCAHPTPLPVASLNATTPLKAPLPLPTTTLCSVTKLKLDHLQHVTPQGLRHLSKLASLHALVLSRCRLDDSVLSALAKLSTLRALTLTSPLQPTGRGAASAAQHFSSLGKLTGLQQLSMHRLEPLPERALLRALPKLTALRVLELQQQEGASDEVLCALTALTALSALTARFCRNVTGRSRTAVLQVRCWHFCACASACASFRRLLHLVMLLLPGLSALPEGYVRMCHVPAWHLHHTHDASHGSNSTWADAQLHHDCNVLVCRQPVTLTATITHACCMTPATHGQR